MGRDMNLYIGFLNSNDRSVFHRSQPATWVDPFWQNKQISGDIADILSGDANSETSWLDVYDPAFEQDLNAFTDGSGTATENYGFTTTGQTGSGTHDSADTTSQSQLLDLIKNRELAK